MYLVSVTLWFAFICNPPQAQWNLLYRGQQEELPVCINSRTWDRVYNVAHVVQGAMLLSRPMAILWKIEIEIKKKIRLFLIWGCGWGCTVVFGLMRMLNAAFTPGPDIFWTYTNTLIWTVLDVTIGMMVISLPILDTFMASSMRKVCPKTKTINSGAVGNDSEYDMLNGSETGSRMTNNAKAIGTTRGFPKPHDTLHKVEQEVETEKNWPLEVCVMRTDRYDVSYTSTKQEREVGVEK